MNRAETTEWISQLFPGEPTLLSAAGQDYAVFRLTEDGRDQAVCTIGAADIDSGMVAPEGAEVRSEIFLVGHTNPSSQGGQDDSLLQVLAHITSLLIDDAGEVAVAPGLLLAGGISGALPDSGTKHSALVVPWVWSNGVPRIAEDAEGQILPLAQAQKNPAAISRITTMLQVVPLTDAEYALAADPEAGGLGALQKKLAAANADLLDLNRPSVV